MSLTKQNIKTPRGFEQWTASQVYQVMKNPVNKGELPENVKVKKFIIEREVFDRFQSKIAENKKRNFATAPKKDRIVHPYGYKVVKQKDGKRTVEIVPERAEIVRAIFNLRLSGCPLFKMVEIMADMEVKSPKGSEWNDRILYDTLKNRYYTGLTDRGYDIPQIISVETFDKVRNTITPKNETLKRNPFASILKCKHCGLTMALNYNNMLECRKCDKQVKTALTTLEETLIERLKFLQPDNSLVQHIIDNYNNIPLSEKNAVLKRVIDTITYDRSSRDKSVEIEIFLKK